MVWRKGPKVPTLSVALPCRAEADLNRMGTTETPGSDEPMPLNRHHDQAGAATRAVARRPIEELLTLACRAPSVHNSQPWLWRQKGDELELFSDPSRQLVHTDPDGRDLVLSCGAALHHLQVAARGLGWRAEVRRLPDPTNPRHLASIGFEPMVKEPGAVDEMLAISARQTDRRRFTSWPVPEERLTTLEATGRKWGAQVIAITDELARDRLRRLTRRADEAQRDDDGYLAELSAHIHDRPDGVSPTNLPKSADDPTVRFPAGDLEDPTRVSIGDPEGILLICTSSDEVVSQLRAGEAMSAVWLKATMEGLCVVPLSQALEVEDTRRAVEGELLDGRGFPQIILRVGWPPVSGTALPPSKRRDLSEVLVRETRR